MAEKIPEHVAIISARVLLNHSLIYSSHETHEGGCFYSDSADARLRLTQRG